MFFIFLGVCQRAHVDRSVNPLLFHLLTSIAKITTADEFLWHKPVLALHFACCVRRFHGQQLLSSARWEEIKTLSVFFLAEKENKHFKYWVPFFHGFYSIFFFLKNLCCFRSETIWCFRIFIFFSAACDIIGRSLVAVNFNKGEYHDDKIISLHCTQSGLINGGSAVLVLLATRLAFQTAVWCLCILRFFVGADRSKNSLKWLYPEINTLAKKKKNNKKTASWIMHKIRILFLSWDIKKSTLIALRCSDARSLG